MPQEKVTVNREDVVTLLDYMFRDECDDYYDSRMCGDIIPNENHTFCVLVRLRNVLRNENSTPDAVMKEEMPGCDMPEDITLEWKPCDS